MSRTIQQHYVTRAYLENFLDTPQATLVVYERNKPNFFRTSPEKVAKRRNYYSAKNDDGTFDDRIEGFLQQYIEDPGLAAIRKLNAGRFQLSRHARMKLSTLVVAQEYRVPWMREQAERVYEEMMQRIARQACLAPGYFEHLLEEHQMVPSDDVEGMAKKFREAFLSGSIELKATSSASMSALGNMLETLPNVYYSFQWTILESRSMPFVTSDCPVHRYHQRTDSHIPFRGVLDLRVEVRFPLSKSKLLVMQVNPRREDLIEKVRRHSGNRAARRAANCATPIKHTVIAEKQVEEINRHTAATADRFLFSGIALARGAEWMSGNTQNVRSRITDLPGGYTVLTTDVPEVE